MLLDGLLTRLLMMREYTIWFVDPTHLPPIVSIPSVTSMNTDFFYFIPNGAKVPATTWRDYEKFCETFDQFPELKLYFNEYAMPKMKQILQGLNLY